MANFNGNDKLSPATVWLFSFGSIALGIGSSYALSGVGQKAAAAAYFAVVAIGAFASTYLTRARLGAAIGAFLVAGLVAAACYFKLVDSIFHDATVQMTDAVSGNDAVAHENAHQAGSFIGKFFGIFVAICVFLETLVASLAGTIAGWRSRGQGGFLALASAARAAR